MDYYNYEFINTYNGHRSPTGVVENDFTTAYFARCLYQRIESNIRFKLPKEWNGVYFRNVLYRNGFIAVIDHPKYGRIPQMCAPSGYGLYMQPTEILVSQPLVQFKGNIGKDCELIRLTPDWRGIWDIVEHYAVLLSTCQTSIDMSLVNSRLAYILAAKNKAAVETLKEVLERISSGEPAVVVDKKLMDSDDGETPVWTEAFKVKENYITGDLLNDFQTILNAFDREVGIPTVDEKRERMITDEVDILTADSSSRLATWTEILNETIGNVNKLFPELNISFTTRREEERRNEPDAETDPDRNV